MALLQKFARSTFTAIEKRFNIYLNLLYICSYAYCSIFKAVEALENDIIACCKAFSGAVGSQ